MGVKFADNLKKIQTVACTVFESDTSLFSFSDAVPFAFAGVGLLNITVLCGLFVTPMEPVSGVGTDTIGVCVDKPRWKEDGSTRPGGC